MSWTPKDYPPHIKRRQAVEMIRDALELIDEPLPDSASYVHAHILRLLDDAAFTVKHEHVVRMPNGRRNGRIDILAHQPDLDVFVAIEIDARRPRLKSIQKLCSRHDWARVIMLRGVGGPVEEHPDIDAFLPIPVRMATDTERARKASVARALEMRA